MKSLKYISGLSLLIAVVFSSCKKEYDDPTVKTVAVGSVKTIAEVRAMHVPGTEVRIREDISVYGVVTADESTGNLYKETYMEDATGGLYLRFRSTSGIYIGDSIRVNLNGTKIIRYNQMLQVDSVHADDNIVKISTLNRKEPEVVEINTLLNNMEAYQAKLVQLNNVRFVGGGQGLTYAYGDTQVSETRVLQNISGDQIDVRTSGYANFANDTLPAGSGTFIGVVAQYNSGLQLIIRDPDELDMDGALPEEIFKDFEDMSLTSGGWITKYPSGSINWTVSSFSGNSYAYITNTSSKLVGASWLISPSLDLSSSSAPLFSFRTATYAANNSLEVYVSTDYDGVSSPTTATGTNLTSQASFSTGSWSWTGSGDLDLSPYMQSNVYVAFKFNGTSASWDTWEVDEIRILK